LMPFRTLRDAIAGLHEEHPVLMDFSPRKKHFLSLVPAGGNWRSLPEELQRESMGKAFFAKGGRSGWWRRLSWDLPCPTVVTMPNHASTSMCHPDEVRTLSVGECAAIQEFPADWEFVGSPARQYAQVGNAVPARLGEVAGQVAARTLDEYFGSEARSCDLPAPPAYRRVYIHSHVRTRQWFRDGEVFVWTDGEDNGHARYSAARARR
jgi:DNA (cytosine-5)-methyltransferase 1